MPAHINKKTIYILGGRKYPFYAVVSCQRKQCQKVVHLAISEQFKNRWQMKESKAEDLSFTPSVYVSDTSCKCHYWIKNSHIVWHSLPPLVVPIENRGSIRE